jgi:hypothetical protein
MSDDTSNYPPEVQAALDEILRIRGVINVTCDLIALDGVRAENLGLIVYAKYPIGSLRRTNGGRTGEGLLQIEIGLSRNVDGWRAVEFLAWHFRDASRGGDVNEFRPFALPPVAGPAVQFGSTLKFLVDLFETDSSDGAPLRRMKRLAEDLNSSIDSYDRMLKDRGDQGLLK